MSRAGLAGLSRQDGGEQPGWGLSCTAPPLVLPPTLHEGWTRCRGRGASPLWPGAPFSMVSEHGHTLTPKGIISGEAKPKRRLLLEVGQMEHRIVG